MWDSVCYGILCHVLYKVPKCVCVKLEQEVEENKLLSEALQTLATEHQEVDQQSLCKATLYTLTEDDCYDALSGQSNPTGLH